MADRAEAEGSALSRRLVLGGVSAALIASARGGSASADEAKAPVSPLSDVPIVLPRTEFVYEAIFDLEPMMQLGEGPLGERRMVPIVGGVFEGPSDQGNGSAWRGGPAARAQGRREDAERPL